jgi:hypothetical protein
MEMPIPGDPITAEARHLKEQIFDEARSRGIDLQELSFRVGEGSPCIRLGVETVDLAGARVRIRNGEDFRPKVITVSGASDGWSRTWQRRLDYTFDIAAVAFLVALIEHERAKPPMPELRVPSGVALSKGLSWVGLVTPMSTPGASGGVESQDVPRTRP